MANSDTWTWVPFPRPLLPLKRLWYAIPVYVCICVRVCGPSLLPPWTRLSPPATQITDSKVVSLPLGCIHSRDPIHSDLRLLWSQHAPLCYRPPVTPSTHRSPKSPSGIQIFQNLPAMFSVCPPPPFWISNMNSSSMPASVGFREGHMDPRCQAFTFLLPELLMSLPWTA